ncbi:HEAT repeat domain-containing protein [Argonema antarcticum]|uniref:HEAT repeat domain-containing protein n=1 Tax=Argonema antarcticum TaxID=2942763 RepID=UPI0020134329|nr:HEAT repeat domain-containing protein [Argonema antarcticum]MCL1472339.1 HEAT repeat domain-containing protein [Argonema antarcticum A004/B2]
MKPPSIAMFENPLTLVFTDLVNSTAIKSKLEGSDISARNRIYRDSILMPHRHRVEVTVKKYGGRKVETIGDAFFLVFPNPIQAVECAIAIQNSHITDPILTPFGLLQVTIGMHTGSPLPDGDRFIGQEVDYAARVAALASAEQILLSEVTAALLCDAQIAELGLHPHGDRDLKGIGRVPILEVLYSDNKEPKPLKDGIKAGIDFWRKISRDRLESQKRLTTNPLTAGEGIKFDLDEIYTPLGLVERKQRDRLSANVRPERGSQLYEPVGIELVSPQREMGRTFENDQFFEQVLKPGQNKKIAIIGEPGSGKTTLLQKIAFWVLDHTEGLPIWISLADWQDKDKDLKLDRYLLQDWLKDAICKLRVAPEVEDDFVEQFNQGRVWLLLDGADEMDEGAEGISPLTLIVNQLGGWLDRAQIVLTCRLNVWDAGKNALESFATYRNLDFPPSQMNQFIRHWFNHNPQWGNCLIRELNKPERERIGDAVKNPLRLALLCRTWQFGAGELPNTKTGLYQQFVEGLYEWKQERFPTTLQQRQTLNECLGQLALEAINAKESRFRLRHSFVFNVLGNQYEQFQLALNLGWLNNVGVTAEQPHEEVYAFFHPTFQEYFAAQAVHNWRYFLNHIPHNPDIGHYRIFEPQWQETILLWLGREDVPRTQKEEFIKALLEFEDDCHHFYEYRAYFLAAAGIAEFKDCSFADGILAQIVHWGFAYEVEKQKWCKSLLGMERKDISLWRKFSGKKVLPTLIDRTCLLAIEKEAKTVLQKTERSRAIAALIDLLHHCQQHKTIRRAAQMLGQIGSANSEAIAALIELLQTSRDEETRRRAIKSLGQIGVGNPEVCAALSELLQNSEDEDTRRLAAYNLGQIDPGNLEAIAALTLLINTSGDEDTRRLASVNLWQIEPGNLETTNALLHLIHTSGDEDTRRVAAQNLGQIDSTNPEARNALINLIHTSGDEDTRKLAAQNLWQIEPGNPEAIAALIHLIHTSGDEDTRRQAAYNLGQIDPGNPEARDALIDLIRTSGDENTRRLAAYNLGEIAPGNHKAHSALLELIRTSRDEDTRRLAAHNLGQIDPGNEEAISALVELVQNSHNQDKRRRCARILGHIAPGNEQARDALIHLLQTSQDEFTCWQAATSLGQVDPGNDRAHTALIELLHSSGDEETRGRVVHSLKVIIQDNLCKAGVSALKFFLSNHFYENDFDLYWRCYELIWHWVQNMSYPDFYEAWHSQKNLPIAPNFNLSELPEILADAISNHPNFSQSIHLICIDGSKFVEPDNPALEIYDQMLDAGCLEREHREPETMQELKFYFHWLRRKWQRNLVLVFYENPKPPAPQGFSDIFLNDLSRFDGAICVVSEQANIPLQSFSPDRSNLIADIVAWIEEKMMED